MQNGSNDADARKDVPFAETNATFLTHLIRLMLMTWAAYVSYVERQQL